MTEFLFQLDFRLHKLFEYFCTREMWRLKIRAGLFWCQRAPTVIKSPSKRSQVRYIQMVKNDLKKWSRNNHLKTISHSVCFQLWRLGLLSSMINYTKNPTNNFQRFQYHQIEMNIFCPHTEVNIASLTHLHLEWSMQWQSALSNSVKEK